MEWVIQLIRSSDFYYYFIGCVMHFKILSTGVEGITYKYSFVILIFLVYKLLSRENVLYADHNILDYKIPY